MAVNLVVQDDAGDVDGANAYNDVAAFKAYCDNRGYDYSPYTDDQIAQAIIRATDFTDTRFQFIGVKLNKDQTTEWPRRSSNANFQPWFDVNFLDPVIGADGDTFVALVGPSGEQILGIPDAIHRAVHEYTFRALTIPLYQDAPAPEGGRLINSQSVQVDVISQSIEYAPPQSGAFAMPAFPAADMLLARAGLISYGRQLIR